MSRRADSKFTKQEKENIKNNFARGYDDVFEQAKEKPYVVALDDMTEICKEEKDSEKRSLCYDGVIERHHLRKGQFLKDKIKL